MFAGATHLRCLAPWVASAFIGAGVGLVLGVAAGFLLDPNDHPNRPGPQLAALATCPT